MAFALVYFFLFFPPVSHDAGRARSSWGEAEHHVAAVPAAEVAARLAQEPGTGEDAQTPSFPISQFIWMHRQERRLLQSQPLSLLTAESEWQ